MIKPYSYPRIVFATIWRALLLGSLLGAVLAVIITLEAFLDYRSPQELLLAIQPPIEVPLLMLAAIGGAIGGLVGFVLGIVNGLYLSAITWLCRPHYQTARFIKFCMITIAILSFLLVQLFFSIAAGKSITFTFIHPISLILALMTAVIAGRAARRGTGKIVACDYGIKLGKLEANHVNQ